MENLCRFINSFDISCLLFAITMFETITKPTDWTTMLCTAIIGTVLPFDEKHARSIRTLIGATVKDSQPDYVFATKVAKGKLFVVRVY